MKTSIHFFTGLFLLLCSCTVENENKSSEKWKAEVIETEKNFADMAAREGIAEAFLAYAATDAVVMRNNKLIIGRDSLSVHFKNNPSELQDEQLDWKPDFVDVSDSGDLAYTYGQFIYSFTDSTGTRMEHKGVFHTVWKRQADGSWLFVWD